MANIERYTTPITNRNIQTPVKEQKSHEAERRDFQDTTKVRATEDKSELLQQNNTLIENQRGPAAFMNLLSDPDVTVGFMKNIFMMMDIVALLPMQNDALTEEFEQLFSQMMVYPDEISQELLNQEDASTAFKGELFDYLRELVTDNGSKQMKNAVINVLKSVNSEKSRNDILRALSGSFEYLSTEMKPSREISARLMQIAEGFASADAPENFRELRQDALDVLYDIEGSILFSSKMSRLVSMIRYDISRYNDNKDFLSDSVNYLMTLIPEEDKTDFLQMLYDHLAYYENRDHNGNLSDSRVLNNMTEILKLQSESEDIKALKTESVENIIHSILSSPSNFTPLLHFIIPVEYDDVSAFAEMWIDPDEDDGSSGKGGSSSSRNIHMYIVFDIDELGKMETEFYIRDRDITLSVYCPEEFVDYISDIASDLRKCASATDYRITEVNVMKSRGERSLVDVFDGLSVKRSGINVRI